MLCLYRSGRQPEALETYHAARRSLVDELGIEPGRQLRELHRAILQQDPELDVSAVPEPARETARGAFVGRGAELAELVGGLDDAFAGRGRLFLLAGEPGIGKSRLVEELIVHAHARAARVLVGRCWEAGGAPAYWPWVQSLRAYIVERDSADVREELGARAGELAQLLPELRELPSRSPEAAFARPGGGSLPPLRRRDLVPHARRRKAADRACARRPARRRRAFASAPPVRRSRAGGQPAAGRWRLPRRRPDASRSARLDPGRIGARADDSSDRARRFIRAGRGRVPFSDRRARGGPGSRRGDSRSDGGKRAVRRRGDATADRRGRARARGGGGCGHPAGRPRGDRSPDSPAVARSAGKR